jgi:hypothetical protein
MTVESKDGSAAVEACFEGCPCCQSKPCQLDQPGEDVVRQ